MGQRRGGPICLRVGNSIMDRVRNFLLTVALAGAAFLPIWFAGAALGTRFGLWHWRFGLGTMIGQMGPILLGVVGLLALVALAFAILVKPRKGLLTGLLALAIPLAGFAYATNIRASVQKIPAIHDISTDWREPMHFSPTLMGQRGAGSNAVVVDGRIPEDYPVPELRSKPYEAILSAAFPDLGGIVLAGGEAEIFDRAMRIVKARGWKLVSADLKAGRIEASATSFWFGFVDDVVIRLSERELGVRVDMRSVSRAGVSDIGANSRRIRAFMKDLRDQ